MFWLTLLLLFIFTLSGSLLVLIVKKPVARHLKSILAFSGAYLLGVTTLYLIPALFNDHLHYTGLFILGGFVLQLIFEQLSQGIEHGHFQKDHPPPPFPLSVILGLSLHSFMEGLPFANTFSPDISISFALFSGILLHKIPAAFVLFTFLLNYHASTSKTVFTLLIFALMTPLGGAFSHLFFEMAPVLKSNWFTPVLGLVTGAFLHISTTILFEAAHKHRFSPLKVGAILLGFSLAVLIYLLG